MIQVLIHKKIDHILQKYRIRNIQTHMKFHLDFLIAISAKFP